MAAKAETHSPGTETCTTGPQPREGSRAAATRFFIGLALFLVLYVTLNVCISATLPPEDADQVRFGQSLALGYQDQPPLYSWLVWCLFQLLGPGQFAVALLEAILLGALLLLLYGIALPIVQERGRAALAASSVLLIPTFAWQAVAQRPHSCLLSVLCVATFAVLQTLRRERRWRDYLLLGAVVGLGLLAQYHYAVFAAALLSAALASPSSYPCRRGAASALVALLLVLPHACWLLNAGGVQLLCAQLGMGDAAPTLPTILWSWGETLLNVAFILAPLVGLIGCFFRQGWWRPEVTEDEASAAVQLLGRYFVHVLGVLLLLALLGPSRTHERWLAPLLLLMPVYLFGRLRHAPLPLSACRHYAWVLGATAVLLLAVLGGRPYFGERARSLAPTAALSAR